MQEATVAKVDGTASDSETLAVPLVGHLLPILEFPNRRLNDMSQAVSVFDTELLQLVVDMFETMRNEDGIGLAAPQVGVFKRVVVLEVQANTPLIFVNPEIVAIGNDELMEWEEGCLSVPGYFEMRKRLKSVVVKYQTAKGEVREAQFTGIYAFAIQHEIDHLNGKTFVDGASQYKSERIRAKIKKFHVKKQVRALDR